MLILYDGKCVFYVFIDFPDPLGVDFTYALPHVRWIWRDREVESVSG